MSEAMFTKGPWKLETVKTSVGVCHKIGPLGNATKLKDACLYDDCYSAVPRDLQLLADAHLIVAAPDMYEALNCWPLKELLGMVEDSGDEKMWSMAQLFMEVQQSALTKAVQP